MGFLYPHYILSPIPKIPLFPTASVLLTLKEVTLKHSPSLPIAKFFPLVEAAGKVNAVLFSKGHGAPDDHVKASN